MYALSATTYTIREVSERPQDAVEIDAFDVLDATCQFVSTRNLAALEYPARTEVLVLLSGVWVAFTVGLELVPSYSAWKKETEMSDERQPIVIDEPMHDWFGLTYAQYLTIPRSVLQSMPVEWQHRFVQCLEELGETIDWVPRRRDWHELRKRR